MGHEFTGVVVEVGPAVGSVQVGDRVVSPFTVSCMECFYCLRGYSSRCVHSQLFGSASLDGGQAQFVRIPRADGTVFKAPPSISNNALLLLADIWPTGFFGAKSGFDLLRANEREGVVAVVIGCGPVGLCAMVAAHHFGPKRLFAIDAIENRLDMARQLGAEPLNYKADAAAMKQTILDASDGRGADLAIEVVGLGPALRTAFDVVRPCGVICSIGVHNGEMPWSASEAYAKNLRLQMGRCPVRSIFPEALALLEKEQDKLGFMSDTMMPLDQAVQGYAKFDAMEAQKVIFLP